MLARTGKQPHPHVRAVPRAAERGQSVLDLQAGVDRLPGAVCTGRCPSAMRRRLSTASRGSTWMSGTNGSSIGCTTSSVAPHALDVTVELTLFSNTYADAVWELNPLHHANNVNLLTPIHWTEHITARYPDRLGRQLALVDKIVERVPGPSERDLRAVQRARRRCPGRATGGRRRAGRGERLAGSPDLADPAGRPRPTSRRRPGGVPLRAVGSTAGPIDGRAGFRHRQRAPAAGHDARRTDVRAGPIHVRRPGAGGVPGLLRGGSESPKPVNLDEDNTASQYTENFGWTIHRKRAWVAVMSGCHYDLIDFTIRPGLPIGSPGSGVRPAGLDVVPRPVVRALADRRRVERSDGRPARSIRRDDVGQPRALPCRRRYGDGAVRLVYLADPAEGTRRNPASRTVRCRLRVPAGTRAVRAFVPPSATRCRRRCWTPTAPSTSALSRTCCSRSRADPVDERRPELLLRTGSLDLRRG